MNNSNLKSRYSDIETSLNDNRYRTAFDQLRSMAALAKTPWTINDEINSLQENYNFLVRYALDGAEDPQRAQQLSAIRSAILSIGAGIIRLAQIADSPTRYFGVLRFEALQSDSNIATLIEQYRKGYGVLSMAMIGHGNQIKDTKVAQLVADQEQLAKRLFDLLWVTYPFTAEQQSVVSQMLVDDSLPSHFKDLMLSALFLGAIEYFDDRRMAVLAQTYLEAEENRAIKALVALVISMWVHRTSLYSRRFTDVMKLVMDSPKWTSDLKMVFLELARTRDTERISRTFNEEILPQMMKMRPDIMKKIENTESIEDLASIEENPEWAEMIEKSGVADKLKELTDLQSDGGDVMMSTFANLKHFPFFNDAANWFLPFYTDHSIVTETLGSTTTEVGEMIDASAMMCDSDKYSIVLALDSMPAGNRRAMLEQFKAQGVNLAELRNSELYTGNDERRNIANKYIQDLYRFFKLYRRKGEHPAIFSSPINLASVPMLAEQLNDSDALAVVGEFYFKRGYYSEASELFELLIKDGHADVGILQKNGYSLQQSGRIEDALEMYSRSEMLRPDSVWTLRRLAQCHKLLNHHRQALDYYQRLEAKKPDDVTLNLNIGHCHLALNNIEEALKHYFKAEYLSTNPRKLWGPIAWTLFLQGKYDRSLEYYQRILSDNPRPGDYLNAGHLQMALKNYREAIKFYQQWGEGDNLRKQILQDKEYLINAGVDPDIFYITLDELS